MAISGMSDQREPSVPISAYLQEQREHIRELLNEVESRHTAHSSETDLRYQQRFDAQTKAVDAALLAADKAINAALAAIDRAVAKAEGAADKRFEGVNEFRAQLNDQAKTFITRVELDSQITRLNDLTQRVVSIESGTHSKSQSQTSMIAVVSVIAAVAAVAISFIMVLVRQS